jgi:hypothetical protein
MARTLWLRWLAALCGGLVVGCLYHRPGTLPDPEPGDSSPPPALASSAPAQPPDPSPSPPSPYSPIVLSSGTRKSASVAPLTEPVTLAVGHGPELPPPKADPPAPAAKPPVPDLPLVSALKYALEKHPDEALQELNKYDQNDRELLLALIRLAAGIDKKDLEGLSAEEVAATLERLRLLTAQLRQRAPLTLDKVCFCQTIDGFGQFASRPAEHKFRAGSDGQPGERVQVYVEVRNFSSAPRQEQYETRLNSSLTILDEQRQEVAKMSPETSIDVSQTPRQDYFLNFQFHVPAKLKPGLYTLWVTVKDVTPPSAGAPQTEREPARRSLDFHVCPPGAEREKKPQAQ